MANEELWIQIENELVAHRFAKSYLFNQKFF